MLQLDTFDTVSKDSLLYPKWGSAMATSAREETLRTVVGLTLHDNGDIRDLMTTRQSYIDRRLAVLYRVPFPFTADWAKYEFPASSGRSGILTQVSMLSMFSHPGRSSPTKRGVALMEIFLCSPTPLPPNDVDFTKVNSPDSTKTLRERLMEHGANRACAACHQHSDPIGLSLEGFDTIGGFRPTENGKPVDVSASIQGKSFSGAVGLGLYMRDNPRYPACVARRLYTYGRGGVKNASVEEFPETYEAFKGSGYRLRALLKSMATSDEFYAAPPPGGATTEIASK
jgi:hypothetical protein